jgi:hypothetical protein
MKHSIFLITLLLGLSLMNCGQSGSKNTSAKADTISNSNDKVQIERLVKQVCKWPENNAIFLGFLPLSNAEDSLYSGMDIKELNEGLKQLKETNFFDNEFLDNYNKIVLSIDKQLKSKKFKWYVGDMPPWGDANPWCNCQDYPYDNPWEKIEFNFITLDNEKAILTWTWGNSEWSKNFNYKVKARKVNGTWKISYLQGFDINEFMKMCN